MTTPERICVFYSPGPRFRAKLRAVRDRYPDAMITVLGSPAHELPSHESKLVDTTVQTEQQSYPMHRPGASLGLIRQIRAARYDRFIVTFDSPRLNVLASLSGARLKECFDGEFWILSLPNTLPGALLRVIGRRVVGTARFVYAWLRVRAAAFGAADIREARRKKAAPTRDFRDVLRKLRARYR